MGVNVWTDTGGDFDSIGYVSDPLFVLPGADPTSFNTDTGTATVTSSGGTTALVSVHGTLHDDGSVPTTITMTNVRLEFDWAVETTGATVTPAWRIGGANGEDHGPGNATGHWSEDWDPALFFGGTGRGDLFIAGGAAWFFAVLDPALSSARVVIANFQMAITAPEFVGLAITSVTPDTGLATGGTPVTIAGSGFEADAIVNFANIAPTDLVVVSDTEITCTTPAHPIGAVDVTVTNPDATFATLVDGFTYQEAGIATVGGLDPAHGPMAGGTTVTIHGAGFPTGLTVTVNGSPATDVTFVDSSTYTFVTPAHSAGAVDVVIGDFPASPYTYDPIVADPDDPDSPGSPWAGRVLRTPEPSVTRTFGQPTGMTFDTREDPPLAGQPVAVTMPDGPAELNGIALQVAETYLVQNPANVVRHVTLGGSEWQVNAKRPIGSWTDTPADEIVLELMADLAPDFSTAGVATGLGAVTITLDGSLTFTDALTAIGDAAPTPQHWYLDGQTLHYFETETATDPDPITPTTPTLLVDAPVTVTRDITQVRNRAYGRGAGSTVTVAAGAGNTVLEVDSLTPFESGGGEAFARGQILRYAGTRRQSEAVNRQAAPNTVSGTTADIIELNDIVDGPIRDRTQYRVSFENGLGEETALSVPFGAAGAGFFTNVPQVPNGFGPLGGLLAPQIEGGIGDPGPGAMALGTYDYVFTLKTAGGETGGMRSTVTLANSGENAVTWQFQMAASGPAPNLAPNDSRIQSIDIYRNHGGTPGADTRRLFHVGALAIDDWTLDGGFRFLWTFTDLLNDASLSGENVLLEERVGINPKTGGSYRIPPENTTGAAVRIVGLPLIPSVLASDVPTGAIQVVDTGAAFGSTAINVTKVGSDATIGSNNIIEIDGAGTYTVVNTATIHGGGTVVSEIAIAPPLRADLDGAEAIAFHPPARKVYRAQANNPDIWELNATFTDNTTTTYVDSTATRPPSYYSEPNVADTFEPAGGELPPGALPPIIHLLLVGIPASGDRSIRKPIAVGSPVNIWVQEDDVPAQIALAARLGGDGIREIVIDDSAKRTATLRDRCRAELSLYSRELVTVDYSTLDPKTREGRLATFDLPQPAMTGSLRIQTVREAKLEYSSTLAKILTVSASSVRFTLDDLLNRALLKGDGQAPSGGGFSSGGSGGTAVSPHALAVTAAAPLQVTVTGAPEIATLADVGLAFATTEPLATSADLAAAIAGIGGGTATGYDAPLTTGDPTTPELIFDSDGDVVMVTGIPL